METAIQRDVEVLVDKHLDEMTAELEKLDVESLEKAMTFKLSDLIREGSMVTEQAYGWTNGADKACALTAAYLAAKARHLL